MTDITGDATPDANKAAEDGEPETADPQTALPIDLPEYHGRKPSGMKTSVNGAGNRITRAHELGERVVLVLEAKVKKAGHEETEQNGLEYSETLKVVDLYEIAGDTGRQLLGQVRKAYRMADDERNGRQSLPLEDLPPALKLQTDESGNILTPSEARILAGDEAPWLVTFECGHQRRWPEEFPPHEPAPVTGDDAPCTQCRAEDGAVRRVEMARPAWEAEPEACPHILVGGKPCVRDRGHEMPHQSEDLTTEAPEPDAAGEPWPGYDGESTSSILKTIAAFEGDAQAALEQVRDHEQAGKARKSILTAVEKRLAS